MEKWYQLFVKAPEGNGYTTPKAMQRVDEHISQNQLAYFLYVNGMPSQEEDGTWQVRVLSESVLRATKAILTGHYGLEIVREQERDD
jgi:hypothetical protein